MLRAAPPAEHVVPVPDAGSAALLEVLRGGADRVAAVVPHPLVADQPRHRDDPARSLHTLQKYFQARMEKYLPHPPDLADAGVAAVAALEVDELAAVVPDLDHGHGVVVRRAQVVHLHRGGDII